MKQNKRIILGKVRNRISGWERKSQWARNWDLERLDQLEIAFDRVRPTIDPGGLLIEKGRAFPSIAHPAEFCRVTDCADERAPEQTLKIECEVRAQPARLPQPWEEMARHSEAGQLAARKNVDMIN